MASSTKKQQDNGCRKNRFTRLRVIFSKWRQALNLTIAAGVLLQTSACTRNFFRKQADEEVTEVLAQKDKYPAWSIDNWHVYPDPRARFAHPDENPDFPAKPPDDPASYAMAPNPQKPNKKTGVQRIEGSGYLDLIAQWDKENREKEAREAEEEAKEKQEPPALPEAEEDWEEAEVRQEKPAAPVQPGGQPPATPANPQAGQMAVGAASMGYGEVDPIVEAKRRSLLDIKGRPTYLLTLDQAAELAMFNSREYQDQRETLYLAALPVTQERFSFMAQFFAGQEAMRAYAGNLAPGGPANNWALNNGTGFSKVLPTGALLLLNFSNQTVFNFLNPKMPTSVTTLNFDAIQPLLRGGGEAVALESLTQAERNLLYQIRNYARFRKELYVEIASNNGGSINGTAFQPSGVLNSGTQVGIANIGASGLTAGVIPAAVTNLSAPILPPSQAGSLPLPIAITPTPSGYLNTMLQNIQVYIDEENIDVLSDIYQRFRGLLEGDIVGPLQVQSVEQQLLAGRYTLLGDQQNYLSSLEAFKIEIGVPAQLNIEMDDSVLRPMMKQFRRARAIIEEETAAVQEASALIALEKAPRVRAELMRLFTRSAIVKGTSFARNIRERWAKWEKMSDKELTARLEALQKEATKYLDLQAELQKKDQYLSPADKARMRDVNNERDLGSLERVLRLYEAAYVEMGKPKKVAPADERNRIRMFQNVLSFWQMVLVEARDDRWSNVRETWPELPRCCVEGVDLVNDDISVAEQKAGQYALEHRLDLMNSRGQVMDAWRQLAVYANALLGFFTVEYQLNASSPANAAQPLNIGGSATTNQLVLNTQLPLVRIQERNNYRASLINYERLRRGLEESEDLSVQVVKVEVSNLRQYAEQYKVQKRQLELGYITIDSSLEALSQPTAPAGIPGVQLQQTRTGADGPAALTQQLLAAQRSLPAAQSGMLTLWINYLDQRLQLYRDLELMPLDARGVWIDQIRECECKMNGASGPELPPVEDGLRLPEPQKLPAPLQDQMKK